MIAWVTTVDAATSLAPRATTYVRVTIAVAVILHTRAAVDLEHIIYISTIIVTCVMPYTSATNPE
jgi:hypothetical protein